MTDEAIDIGQHISGICETFGLDKKNVGHISIDPNKIKFEIYLLNESGSKYVDESGNAAQDTQEYAITT